MHGAKVKISITLNGRDKPSSLRFIVIRDDVNLKS
jgi:hypothetical protein